MHLCVYGVFFKRCICLCTCQSFMHWAYRMHILCEGKMKRATVIFRTLHITEKFFWRLRGVFWYNVSDRCRVVILECQPNISSCVYELVDEPNKRPPSVLRTERGAWRLDMKGGIANHLDKGHFRLLKCAVSLFTKLRSFDVKGTFLAIILFAHSYFLLSPLVIFFIFSSFHETAVTVRKNKYILSPFFQTTILHF